MPLEPGLPHDITAARAHALPALCRVTSLGLCTAVHKGYTGAGTGINVMAQNADSDVDTRWCNEPIAWAVTVPFQMHNIPVVREAVGIVILKACLGSSRRISRVCCTECRRGFEKMSRCGSARWSRSLRQHRARKRSMKMF